MAYPCLTIYFNFFVIKVLCKTHLEKRDMLYILNIKYGRVLGDEFCEWNRPVNAIQAVMEPDSMNLNTEEFWNWLRNPLPPSNVGGYLSIRINLSNLRI